MEFSSIDVIAYVVYWCKTNEITVNTTKAQKLLYCCYGAVLADSNERLIDEHPRAWLYGPVFGNAHDATANDKLTVGNVRRFLRLCPQQTLDLVNKTLKTFARYSSTQLSKWASIKGSPWVDADPFAALDDRAIALWFQPYLNVINTVDEHEEMLYNTPSL